MLEAGKALCNFGVAFSFQKRLRVRKIFRRGGLHYARWREEMADASRFSRFPDISNSSQNGESHHKARSSIRDPKFRANCIFPRSQINFLSDRRRRNVEKQTFFLEKELSRSRNPKLGNLHSLARKMSLALSISSRD